ncbi:hypothetical protein OJF2_48170 [Aquisphaera giovannonii]|uniref:Uncharacterized protein n=1 Tax=Aquisphaera giovannonii TaxID=406548 RepID=A0A5B9W7D4_9BACT|nr:hypothetical protein [Aquisphaera giovannonii]QEH36257.1 hypothetical protein OJF2_48170 [Aquisphaera giovannonii]
MLTRFLDGRTGRVVAALAVFAGMTGLANAQQGGLLPLHPIKRQRVPCPSEDPIYATYRNQYYGYYPTQWRPFPQGWNLAGPETPNVAAEFQRLPLTAEPAESDEDNKPEQEGPEGGNKPAAPSLPPNDTRSPFEMDAPDGGAAPRRPPAARPTPGTVNTPPADRPANATPAPGTADSPFDTPEPKPAAGSPTPARPDLGPPAVPRASRSTRSDRDEETLPARVAGRGPLLEAPDATLPDVEEAGQPGGNSVLGGPAASAPVAQPVAAQPAASRRGRLSALFGGWLRR